MLDTVCENRPCGFFLVPLNSRCSRKCARPDLPGVSSAAPTRYHTMWVITGVRRSGITTTSSPLARVKWDTSGPQPVAVCPLDPARMENDRAASATTARFMAWRKAGLLAWSLTRGSKWRSEDTAARARRIRPNCGPYPLLTPGLLTPALGRIEL